MTSFEDITQLISVFNVVDANGAVVEQDVPADFKIKPEQELVFSRQVPKFHLMQYTELFQAIIDKIKQIDSKA